MPQVNCPKCGVSTFAIEPSGLLRFHTRCENPSCRVRYTVLSKRSDITGKIEYRLSVGFTPGDREANGDKSAGRTELDKLKLDELRNAKSELEDFFEVNISYYQEAADRVTAYVNSRIRNEEERVRKIKREEDIERLKLRKVKPPPAATKKGVDVDAYRQTVISMVTMQYSMMLIDKLKHDRLIEDAKSSLAGLWRTCEFLKLPRLD